LTADGHVLAKVKKGRRFKKKACVPIGGPKNSENRKNDEDFRASYLAQQEGGEGGPRHNPGAPELAMKSQRNNGLKSTVVREGVSRGGLPRFLKDEGPRSWPAGKFGQKTPFAYWHWIEPSLRHERVKRWGVTVFLTSLGNQDWNQRL